MSRMAQDVAQLMDISRSRARSSAIVVGDSGTPFYKQFPSRGRALILATRHRRQQEENKPPQQAGKALTSMAGIADAMCQLLNRDVSKRPES